MRPKSDMCSLQIMVVEDHLDSLQCISMYLEVCGHRVQQARGVEEAIAAFHVQSIDVLITDIGLPDGNGWELMDRLRLAGEVPKHAIAMSGYGMCTDRARSTAAGFREHLVKPLDPEKLDRLLSQIVQEMSSEVEEEALSQAQRDC